ncbi:uncharacterized protein LOC124498168 [Dermatophagoides farinae]|uniref:uncharacterized protein LOC124498168 n=1 Tax=Dermatophagoides farinae TaxID=6954 RepID=UPI003F6360A5
MNLHSLVTLEAIFIIMLIVITWRQDSIELFKCSRDRSKIVRDVIYKKLIPIFIRHKTNLSHECPFHPDREFLWWPMSYHYDDNVDDDDDVDDGVHDHHSYWTCPICGVDFHCSERLIFHWDTEHRYSRPYREDFVCLADYCDIFRCDIIIKKMLQRRKRFLNYLSFGKSSDIRIGQCDSANMVILQEMCLNVIQQCMISIDMNITTSQTLKSLRKELSDSLCSYLTCEHYHDDLFTDDGTISHKVPIILFTIVGFIMFCGFILVYYFIWNVFNQSLINDNDNGSKKIPDNNSERQNYDNNSSFVVKAKNENCKKSSNRQTNVNNCNHLHNKKQSKSSSSDKFFQNIFEFNQEKYDNDSFEFNDLEQNQVSKFKAKLHAINSIIEEEEEESEFDISVHSYPNINRKNLRRNQRKTKLPMKENDSKQSSQEICFKELPMKFHPKYVQPIKHSYSDQYPCYSDPMSYSFAMLSNKSRSFSHSHLRNVHNQNISSRMFSKNPRRQYSLDEVEWEPPISSRNSQESHSNPALQQLTQSNAQTIYSNKPNPISPSSLPLTSRCKLSEWNGPPRHRPISKSAMSYHMMHPSKRRELYAASKTNSDASIGSGSSRCSNPTSFKN